VLRKRNALAMQHKLTNTDPHMGHKRTGVHRLFVSRR
jgi:hypothetical protein